MESQTIAWNFRLGTASRGGAPVFAREINLLQDSDLVDLSPAREADKQHDREAHAALLRDCWAFIPGTGGSAQHPKAPKGLHAALFHDKQAYTVKHLRRLIRGVAKRS